MKPNPGELAGLDSLLDVKIEDFRAGLILPQSSEASQLSIVIAKLNDETTKANQEIKNMKLNRIRELKNELMLLIEENKNCEDLEKLDISEFVVNTEQYEKELQLQKEKEKKLLEEIELKKKKYILLKSQYIEEFWDPMDVK